MSEPTDTPDHATRLVTALLAGNESLRDRLEAMDRLLHDASEEIERLKQPEARWYEAAMKMLAVAPNHVAASFDMGGRRVEITFYNDGGKTPGEVAGELRVERDALLAAAPTPSDRTALSTAAFELKKIRSSYAGMLNGFERGGADPFVIESYRDSVKACDAAIEVCERLAKGGGS
jgi:hypothetical protein